MFSQQIYRWVNNANNNNRNKDNSSPQQQQNPNYQNMKPWMNKQQFYNTNEFVPNQPRFFGYNKGQRSPNNTNGMGNMRNKSNGYYGGYQQNYQNPNMVGGAGTPGQYQNGNAQTFTNPPVYQPNGRQYMGGYGNNKYNPRNHYTANSVQNGAGGVYGPSTVMPPHSYHIMNNANGNGNGTMPQPQSTSDGIQSIVNHKFFQRGGAGIRPNPCAYQSMGGAQYGSAQFGGAPMPYATYHPQNPPVAPAGYGQAPTATATTQQ